MKDMKNEKANVLMKCEMMSIFKRARYAYWEKWRWKALDLDAYDARSAEYCKRCSMHWKYRQADERCTDCWSPHLHPSGPKDSQLLTENPVT